MLAEIKNKLKLTLVEDRFQHSLGVSETAVKLAQKYGYDTTKASIAGLVHDCAKCFSDKVLMEKAAEFDIEINLVYKMQPQLLHGHVGACIAQKEFMIDDYEILHAIKYHTTGCENMSMLDKIVYIADYIEPGRHFPGVDLIREETFKDINKGILMALDNTIKYVIQKRQLIDELTVKARNYMLYYENI